MTAKGPFERDTLRMTRLPIETERLRLRTVVADDVDMFAAMESDPEVMAHMPDHIIPVDEYREKMLAALDEGMRYRFFLSVAFRDNPDHCLGWIFLRPTEDGAEIEVGYRLWKDHWGQGIIPEALDAAFAIPFKDWGANEVMAGVDDGNAKSDRVLEKLGFKPRGQKMMYGEMLNYFVLTRGDWEARRAA